MPSKRTKITPHFSLEEFHCKDGTPYPPEWLADRLTPLCQALETIRYVIQSPLIIHSGFRTPEYNRRIGGARSSYHLKGMAADFSCPKANPRLLYLHIKELIQIGAIPRGGIGLYPSFIHYDIRGFSKFWRGTRTKN